MKVVAALEEKKSAMVEKEAEEDASNCDLDGSNSTSPPQRLLLSSIPALPPLLLFLQIWKYQRWSSMPIQFCNIARTVSREKQCILKEHLLFFSFSFAGVKFSAFESDNVDVVEEAVLKTEVDSFPVSEWQQGKVDSIKEVSIPPHLMVGDFKGIKVQEAKPMIRNKLLESEDAVMYREPGNKIMSRSGDECVVALTGQWHITYGEAEWKTKAEDCLAKMNSH